MRLPAESVMLIRTTTSLVWRHKERALFLLLVSALSVMALVFFLERVVEWTRAEPRLFGRPEGIRVSLNAVSGTVPYPVAIIGSGVLVTFLMAIFSGWVRFFHAPQEKWLPFRFGLHELVALGFMALWFLLTLLVGVIVAVAFAGSRQSLGGLGELLFAPVFLWLQYLGLRVVHAGAIIILAEKPSFGTGWDGGDGRIFPLLLGHLIMGLPFAAIALFSNGLQGVFGRFMTILGELLSEGGWAGAGWAAEAVMVTLAFLPAEIGGALGLAFMAIWFFVAQGMLVVSASCAVRAPSDQA